MTKAIVVRSLSQAYKVIKEMNLSQDWESDYRAAGRQALVAVLRDRMDDSRDQYLARMGRSLSDRRNGSFSRHLLTELGDIEIAVPRTRRWSALEVIRAYSRRVASVDRIILSCFVLGLSTRKVSQALLPILGESVSAATVSRVARILDSVVAAFHRRPLQKKYRFLVYDGVVLKRKTGAGVVKRTAWLPWASPSKERRRLSTSGWPGRHSKRLPIPGEHPIRKPQRHYNKTRRNCLCSCALPSDLSGRRYEPPMPSNDGSGKSNGGPDPWECSPIQPAWNESSTPCSPMKT